MRTPPAHRARSFFASVLASVTGSARVPATGGRRRPRVPLFEALEGRQLLAADAPLATDVAEAAAHLEFYRAINLNGRALTIDGNPWESSSGAANFAMSGLTFSDPKRPLNPSTDAARAEMIRSSVFGIYSGSVTLSNVPSGTYQVSLYNWEDDKSTSFSISLEGQVVAANVSSGHPGSWRKLTWTVSVTDGALNLVADGRDANLSGIEVYRVVDDAPTPPPPVPTVPAAPSGLTASARSTGRIDLAWADNSSDETSFVVERKTGSTGAWTTLATLGAGTTSYSDLSVAASTTYSYRVAAVNGVGASGFSNEAQISTPAPAPVPPAAPSSLAASAASETQVNLTWSDNAGNETSFVVERRLGGTTSWSQVVILPANSTGYQDVGLSASTSYAYRVKAVGDGGASAWSNEASVVTMAAPEPEPEPDPETDPTTTKVEFYRGINLNGPALVIDGNAWEAGATASGLTFASSYALSFASQGSTLSPATDAARAQMIRSSIFGITGGTLRLTVPNGTYQVGLYNWEDDRANTYSISLEGQSVVSDFSSGPAGSWRKLGPWTVTITDGSIDLQVTGRDVNLSGLEVHRVVSGTGGAGQDPTPTVPAAPSDLVATLTSSTQVTLTWADRSSNETAFLIERKAGEAGAWSLVGSVGAGVTTYQDAGLAASTQFFYRVRAVNDAGASAYSGEASVATPSAIPNAPTSLAATAVSFSQVNLTWSDKATNETAYVVERKIGASGAWAQVATLAANSTSFQDASLSASTSYVYRVRALNGSIASAYSNEASVTTPAEPTEPQPPAPGTLSRLSVSPDGRYLVDASGKPFFWLADTAWELFHRLNRAEAEHYLTTRAAQGFNVIQAVAIAELDGFNSPNAYGDAPLAGGNAATPLTTPGADPASATQYDYWDHVDYIVNTAESLGLYTALLPTWGSHVNSGAITASAAEAYGRFLGERYRNEPIIWVLGGDRQAYGREEVWRALARGIAIGVSGSEDYSKVLMTYHAPDGDSSSLYFHNDAWLDFNMFQSGHGARDLANYVFVERDYARKPVKPTLDGEPRYEDSPVNFNVANGRFDDFDVRQAAYWSVFSGALGHTYGHTSVWQMWEPGRTGYVSPVDPWSVALTDTGALDMQHLRKLMESRPILGLVPDQGLVVNAYAGADHVRAIRGQDHAFIYTPTGKSVTVNMGRISGATVKASWYDPRTGTWTPIGTFANAGTQTFTPPSAGRGNDWVLVLDDSAAGR